MSEPRRISRMKTLTRTLGFLLLALAPASAFAHHAEWMQGRPFIQGLSMPIHGLDHLLVTLGVGLLAVQIGGRALWAVPGSFAALLLAGGVMNVCGASVPFVEQGILASVILLGAMLALKPQWPLAAGLAIVAMFAMLHGSVLIGEAPHNAWFPLFTAGCLLTAFAVLGCGMLAGFVLQKISLSTALIRYAGAAIIAMGGVIFLFPKVNDVIIHVLE
jgi:urease accessory protein